MSTRLPLDVKELIPHRWPMRLVDRLLDVSGKNGIAEAQIEAQCPLVNAAGELEDVAYIELIAQSYAALKGYLNRMESKPLQQGFLVGIKKLTRFQSARVGEQLKIEMNTLLDLEDFAIADGKIWRGDQMLAHGEIKVWIN